MDKVDARLTDRRARVRRFFGTPFGLVVVLAAFAMPWIAVAQYCDDADVPSAISGDIYGYEMIVGGLVPVSGGDAGEVAGVIDDERIGPNPIAIAILVLAATGLWLTLGQRQPAQRSTITAPGVLALAGLMAWAALPSYLDSRLVDPDSFTIWRFGALVAFVGFVWALLSAHLEAIRPRRARVLVAYNAVMIAIFLLYSIQALERASELTALPIVAVIAVDALVIFVKWLRATTSSRLSRPSVSSET